jgi:6,7-dimethyl-8-ribityllumazine synthase
VIRGETTHYDYVCGESARGLMDLTVKKGLPIGYGVLTVEDEAQAWARARISEGDKGGFAARACLDMVALRRRLLGQNR